MIPDYFTELPIEDLSLLSRAELNAETLRLVEAEIYPSESWKTDGARLESLIAECVRRVMVRRGKPR